MYRILNVGIDLVEIERIDRILREKPRFVERYFRPEEVEPLKTRKNFARHLAGRFAAKEAVVKALGTGFTGIPLKDICVLNDEKGKPYVRLYGNAEKKSQELGVAEIALSISFTRNTAAASAVALVPADD